MADVADGRFRPDARAGASLHCAGDRAGPRLRPETLHDGDAQALWRARPPSGRARVRGGTAVGRRLRDSRLGLASSAPQGRAVGFPECQTLVRHADGAPGRETRHGDEAGLSFALAAPTAVLQTAMPGDDSDCWVRAVPYARFASNAIRTASPASTVPIK